MQFEGRWLVYRVKAQELLIVMDLFTVTKNKVKFHFSEVLLKETQENLMKVKKYFFSFVLPFFQTYTIWLLSVRETSFLSIFLVLYSGIWLFIISDRFCERVLRLTGF